MIQKCEKTDPCSRMPKRKRENVPATGAPATAGAGAPPATAEPKEVKYRPSLYVQSKGQGPATAGGFPEPFRRADLTMELPHCGKTVRAYRNPGESKIDFLIRVRPILLQWCEDEGNFTADAREFVEADFDMRLCCHATSKAMGSLHALQRKMVARLRTLRAQNAELQAAKSE